MSDQICSVVITKFWLSLSVPSTGEEEKNNQTLTIAMNYKKRFKMFQSFQWNLTISSTAGNTKDFFLPPKKNSVRMKNLFSHPLTTSTNLFYYAIKGNLVWVPGKGERGRKEGSRCLSKKERNFSFRPSEKKKGQKEKPVFSSRWNRFSYTETNQFLGETKQQFLLFLSGELGDLQQ